MRTKTAATLASLAVISTLLAGCGPTKTPKAAEPPIAGPVTAPTSPASSAAAPVPAIKDLTPGNCTLFTKDEAVKLLGGVTGNNKLLDIGVAGGTKIDQCTYSRFTGATSLQGTTYAVVRYDSAATAAARAKQLQTEMLGSAADNNWAVQSLTTPAPGAGPVLGGFATKTEDGIPVSLAVVGTNIGPYLVAALGASTVSEANAKKFALTVFKSLSATLS